MCLAAGRRRHLEAKQLHQVGRRQRIIFHDLAVGETLVGQDSGQDLLPGGRVWRRDCAAVSAALALPWSNGPVAGQVNRLKRIASPG
jgi:hypothetical protein